jgi:hypothetical protein
MISWALQVVFTLGIGLAWVVPQVVAAVAKTAAHIADITGKLIKALKALIPLLKKAGALFADAATALKNIKPGKGAPNRALGDLPPGPKSPGAPVGGKGGGGTPPSSATPPPKGGDGSTTPSGSGGNGHGSPNPAGDHQPKAGGDQGLGNSTTPSGSGSGSGGSGGGNSGGGKGTGGGNGGIRQDNTNPAHNSTSTKDLPNCGDPVDVATGRMFLTQVDVELLASLPLVVSRTHLSDYRSGRSFGPTWASTADQRLEVDEDGISFAAEDGALLTYPTPGATGRTSTWCTMTISRRATRLRPLWKLAATAR